ncbi:LysR family transcriptional regulator [Acinetobacter sp. ANC 4173]|uniref:LysR family transcriptional regulator n=1 Tax=Acinetobacter sp. ANC 4173 TaxID=2529837 RepID=UPI001039BF6B|nr:LysR family transcriptional regulator [Acinetobacter sp. ANC 4173]TCB77265.1 LysR family transcriptional regulator [Acinetobacter sp. ANC 4173]
MQHSLDRFAGIDAFVATAKVASFTLAAEILEMTPSGVAKSVTRLEARIGLKLFHRTTRKLTLTPEGEVYLTACLRAIDELDAAETGLVPKDWVPQGRVHIGVPGAFGRRHVLPSLLNMATQFEKLDLTVSFTERTMDLVEEGYDLSVRIGELTDDSNLVAKRLGTQRLVICAAPSYLQKYGTVETPEELQHRDCIIGSRRQQKQTWLLRTREGKFMQQEIRVRHEFSDGEAMLAAGLAGCGIMQMPTWLVHAELQRGSLISLLDDFAGGEMPIHVIWPKSHYLQPKVRAVIDMLQVVAGQQGSRFNP